ncbi:MAG: hypothetical protein KC493_16005 [Bacteriovoracaceae bacterium]|nr:hypothetical protein [Bacteriovoracaceae bacterium]
MSRIKLNIQNPFNSPTEDYETFDQIDGSHPLKKKVPESVVEYKARYRDGGKVAAFNFDLAKEIGLLDEDHPDKLSKSLSKKILDTFSIMIINEYDEIVGKKFPEDQIKPNTYMATRYLQLQHPNKQGKTSGDGRSIWNGQVKHKGKVYDISSCGTGATCLSPATHLYGRYFESGDPSISYGCGYSEVDEGFSTLFFSEIFEKNKIGTERLLAVIEFPNKISINVRVHQNLIRPSHMFNHLKQGNHEALTKMVDYHIAREKRNKIWKEVPKGQQKYDYFLNKECEIFSDLVARFESDYIFCWLDWDGDNILMDGSVIDFGSIRQFGLFHHEYRFDDVSRFSTSIKEQKHKAKYCIQTFAQLVDYVKTGKRKPLKDFNNHQILKKFDKVFEDKSLEYFVTKIGFNSKDTKYLLKSKRKEVLSFYKTFCYFERYKSLHGLHEVGDGINWDAIYCMRDLLRELPQLYLSRGENIKKSEFIEIARSSYATDPDVALTNYKSKKIKDFQESYWKLINLVSKSSKKSQEKILLEISMRSSIVNKFDRVTGDSITTIVNKILGQRPKLSPVEIQKILRDFSEYQNMDPDTKDYQNRHAKQGRLMKGMLKIVRDYREGL